MDNKTIENKLRDAAGAEGIKQSAMMDYAIAVAAKRIDRLNLDWSNDVFVGVDVACGQLQVDVWADSKNYKVSVVLDNSW